MNEKIEKLTNLSTKLETKLEDKEQELAKIQEDHKLLNEKFLVTTNSLSAMKASKKEFETASQKYQKELQEALKRVTLESTLKQLKENLIPQNRPKEIRRWYQ